MDEEDKVLTNKVLAALREVPVVRASLDLGVRKPLLLSERMIVARAMLPLLKEARDGGKLPSQDY